MPVDMDAIFPMLTRAGVHDLFGVQTFSSRQATTGACDI
ncbi:hypothetical protein CHEID_06180 [Corynebacterium heidelbergense]|nr:hypothetical protein CHEID_06180 [Corynebacterium heidelbergense]